MKIVVQNIGGSSLSTPEKTSAVARKVTARKREGYEVAVVVSAINDITDRGPGIPHAVCRRPVSRELEVPLMTRERASMSLLSRAISAEGQRAVSLTGPRAGILTCGSYNRVRIEDVQPTRVLQELAQGKVVVVGGFQGVSRDGEVTTLGRGGSDTSAVALAAALKAERCDVYSDVDGVYSGDPRILSGARQIEKLSYSEMIELSRLGARVLCAEAVEYARSAGLTVRALSTFGDGPGTVVDGQASASLPAVAVAGRKDVVRIRVTGRSALSRLGPFLIRSKVLHHHCDDIFLLADDYPSPSALAEHARQELGAGVEFSQELGAVGVIGSSLGEFSHGRARAAGALAASGIRALEVLHRPLSLTCLVDADEVHSAVVALHDSFIFQEVSA